VTRASALVVRLRRAAGALTSPRFSTLVNSPQVAMLTSVPTSDQSSDWSAW
jgi:hypothetical protein